MTDRFLCGWRLRSVIELPELATWSGADCTPDVQIEFGAVPRSVGGRRLGGGKDSDGYVEVAPDGTAILDIADTGRFLIADGQNVTIEAVQPIDPTAIRLYLLGTVLATLSYQRGLLPLHASCLSLGPGAVAIAGDSGVGKSTLAATLALRGVPILADDVCLVDPSAPGGPVVWPSVSRIKLWQDAMDRLSIPVDGVERIRKGVDKYALSGVAEFQTNPTLLIALYHLTRAAAVNEEPPRAVSGVAAVKLLYRSLYRGYIGDAMGKGDDTAKALMAILASVPVFSLWHDPKSTEVSPLPNIILKHQQYGATL